MSGKKIAFFDFDGTITRKDSLLEFIQFLKGTVAMRWGLILNSPWILAYKLNWMNNDKAKQKLFVHFFGGMPEKTFQEKCDEFADHVVPQLIRPAAFQEIEKLKIQGFEIVVVSASAGNWIRNWTRKISVGLVATELEVENGIITGRIKGKNCHGEQKVICIRDQWNLREYEKIYAYGDTEGDKPMLALATDSFYKPFRTE